jgi:predicted HNH restriction endonuclease
MLKKCTECKIEKELDQFYNSKAGKYKKTSKCKVCLDIANKKWDIANKERNSKYKYDRRQNIKKQLFDYLGGKCKICGLIDHMSCYDFHHVNPQEKEKEVSYIAGYSLKRAMKEVEKCILLCSNCHRKLHAGVIEVLYGDNWEEMQEYVDTK